MSDKAELIDYLKNTQLFALPQSASQMLELSKDPNNGPQEFAKPISADLGLSTQVLRFINSSFFGFRYKITSIPLALTLASVRTIRNYVLWNGLFAMLPNPQCGPFSVKILFQDALRRAVFARIVTECYTKLDSDEAFTCALMQDIAIPFLAEKWGDKYAKMILLSNTEHVRLSALERDVLSWDHSDAGAILVVGWNLGKMIGDAVSQHTGDVFAGRPSCEPTHASITALSALLPKVPDVKWFEAVHFVNAFRKLFGPRLTEITAVLSKSDAVSEQLTDLVNLGRFPKTLSMCWRDILRGLPWAESDDVTATEEQLAEYFAQVTVEANNW